MSNQGQGVISQNDLMSKLVQAKKVMNKVDGGNFERGHVNESMLQSSPEELMNSQQPSQPRKNMGSPSIDKIQNSKLPDAIKKAMIEHPIEQMQSISLNDTLDMDFIKGAKRLMEQEGVSSKSSSQPKQTIVNNNIDMNAIAVLIENTVRKVMDEKLNQILTASTTSSINENLVLKVGDSIFKGKITGVNKAK
jgi:hypothetical protein